MVAHRYWRIKTTSGTTYTSWCEIEMRSVSGGADLTGITGSAISDSFYAPESLTAAKAFDGVIATANRWASNGTGNNAWVGWDFGAGNDKDIIEVVLTNWNTSQSVTVFDLQYSDDLLSWTTKFQRTPAYTDSFQSKTFTYDGLGDLGRVLQLGVMSVSAAETSSGQHDVEAFQLGGIAVGQHPAAYAYSLQAPLIALTAAETSNGFHDVIVHELGAYALVRGRQDRRDLRAWTFTQDDHDFYVLQLGNLSTLIYDKRSGQWARWTSPDKPWWRGSDGCAWEGYNLCCDTESGIIWEIDPSGRLDYGTTPIISQITGQVTARFRNFVNCYMAELAVSEAQPPAGVDEGTVGITLTTQDSNGLNVFSHGTVVGEGQGEDISVRWYGLGLMKAPGRVFNIVDTGYARRIDGLNLEIGDNGGN